MTTSTPLALRLLALLEHPVRLADARPPRRAGSGSARARRLAYARSGAEEVVDDEVDQLDADERRDQAADAVDEEVAAQERGRADRAVAHALQRERDERRDDERVEDDRREDRALGACRAP